MHSDEQHLLGRVLAGFGLNALSGIGCIRTILDQVEKAVREEFGLNALSGIGCIRTIFGADVGRDDGIVLMPCRALDAFGPRRRLRHTPAGRRRVLMPCRALDAFGPAPVMLQGVASPYCVLMPCRALDAFGRLLFSPRTWSPLVSLNALSGIGCIRTEACSRSSTSSRTGLNALSGIGCIRTDWGWYLVLVEIRVLMPCRALDAFGRRGLQRGRVSQG